MVDAVARYLAGRGLEREGPAGLGGPPVLRDPRRPVQGADAELGEGRGVDALAPCEVRGQQGEVVDERCGDGHRDTVGLLGAEPASYDRQVREAITIEASDPSWTARAAAAAVELRGALPDVAIGVDHVGSTAIPGMDAKPILDLQMRVRDLDTAALHLDVALPALGYRPSDIDRDHVPAGRTDDWTVWRKAFWTRRDQPADDVNLHVRRDGAPNARLAVLFRDWFRANPEAVPAYIEFKRRAAASVAADDYADLKDPVVDLVIVTAERWAFSTGWSPGRWSPES